MRNVLLTIEYDGSQFHGWQIQPRARTVQGVLEDALTRVCGEPIRLNGASRTDAGVHAYGQAASFVGDFGIPSERIPVVVNHLLKDVRILSAHEVPPGFHARYDAVGKTYLYRIATVAVADIFLRNYSYFLNEGLNTGKMREAARHLTGIHDFSAFQSAGSAKRESTVRTIADLTIEERFDVDTRGRSLKKLEIRVTGDGFLYNMVRIIVGTLVETGLGVRAPEDMADVVASCDRSRAGPTAPASGLYLNEVIFGEGIRS
jgi:tRNA pseudouridine38-40 synthase